MLLHGTKKTQEAKFA